jgi:hypothetical protein
MKILIGLSPDSMSKWLGKFLEKDSQTQPDKTDKPHDGGHLSGLSVLSGPSQTSFQSFMDKKIKNKKNIFKIHTDKTDKPHDGGHLSVLSVPSGGTSDGKLESISKICTDKPDKPDKPPEEEHLSNFWGLTQSHLDKYACGGSPILEDFVERLAIAQYDGRQNDLQAQCIAYRDAFMAALRTRP